MLLFIHDIANTKSFWLPQIRGLFNLSSEYSDQELINLFTIALPGHSFKDKEFDLDYIFEKINDFILDKRLSQENLAEKIRNDHCPEFVKVLTEKRITIVGHGLGGALAFEYLFKFTSQVGRIVVIDTGIRFNKISLNLLKLKHFLFKLLPKKFFEKSKSKKSKHLSYLLKESESSKGLKSSFQLMKKYNFLKSFNQLQNNQKIQVATVPIFSINSEINIFNSLKKTRKIKDILNQYHQKEEETESALIHNKKTPFNHFKIYIEKSCFSSPQDKDLPIFVHNIKKFIRKNLRLY